MNKEQLNHQAYNDVVDNNDPSFPDDEYYMKCYRSWKPLAPEPFLDSIDLYEW